MGQSGLGSEREAQKQNVSPADNAPSKTDISQTMPWESPLATREPEEVYMLVRLRFVRHWLYLHDTAPRCIGSKGEYGYLWAREREGPIPNP